MTDGEALLKTILANPEDDTLPLILADYLQENGAVGLGISLRAAVQLRRDPIVYLVNSGAYSDYRVHGVFSSKENAEKFMEHGRAVYDGFNEVEEFKLNECISELESGLLPFYVIMDRDNGDNARVSEPSIPFLSDREFVYTEPGRLIPVFGMSVWARGEQHAIKIVNEKRIMYLAAKSQGVRE